MITSDQSEMTLEQVRDELRRLSNIPWANWRVSISELADAVDAHLKSAHEPVAWLFTCIKPGKRSQFSSIDKDTSEHWPLDQWASVTVEPLYTTPLPVTVQVPDAVGFLSVGTSPAGRYFHFNGGTLEALKSGNYVLYSAHKREVTNSQISDEEIRAEWRTAGGSMHGPIIEHVSMSERQYFELRRSFDATPPAVSPAGTTQEQSGVWIVQDDQGQPIFCASRPEACHEHINDAINEHGITEASAWKVLHYGNASPAGHDARKYTNEIEQLKHHIRELIRTNSVAYTGGPKEAMQVLQAARKVAAPSIAEKGEDK
jgi:hypothetical protein